MEPELNIWIRQAEDMWLHVLHAYAEELFRNRALPSHDQSHHLRVWNLCKSLLKEISLFNPKMDQALVEGVLIAAFFHDLGMAFSTREDHGRLSRRTCEEWFKHRGGDLPDRYDEILRAIELHDKKEDQLYGSLEPGRPPEILLVLSVADDLEALGTIGIYRYAEIYLLRGVLLEDLATRILDNVRSRFEKLETACLFCPQLLEKYRAEYDELREFYEQYNLQLQQISNTEEVRSGPLGVINYIRRQGPGQIEPERAEEELKAYFLKLKDELEKARS